MPTEQGDLLEMHNLKDRLPKFPISYITDKNDLKNFEALWLVFMCIFVFLLLFALVMLIIKIGTRERFISNDDSVLPTPPPPSPSLTKRQSISVIDTAKSNFEIKSVMNHMKDFKQTLNKFRKNKISAQSATNSPSSDNKQGDQIDKIQSSLFELKNFPKNDLEYNFNMLKIKADRQLNTYLNCLNSDYDNSCSYYDSSLLNNLQSNDLSTTHIYDVKSTIVPTYSPTTSIKFVYPSNCKESKFSNQIFPNYTQTNVFASVFV